MDRRRIRMEDLAARCGVSVATVSRVLADRPGVRAELRDRVQAAAVMLGYAVPASIAGQTAVLVASQAAMVDVRRSQFTLHVLDGMRDRATALGMTLQIGTTAGARGTAQGADAAIAGYLLLSPDDDADIAAAALLDRPVILVNADDPMMRLSSVAPCNRTAAARATDVLLRLGHRRILFLTRPGRRTIARRREGWADRLTTEGLHPDPALVLEVDDWLPEVAAAAVARRLAQGPRDFTAILAAGDSLAIGALMALAQAGIDVPGQVSVMGFDGLPQCALQSPPLSAVEIPMQAIGRLAIDLLREAHGAPDLPARRIELACRIIERGSTGPAPATGTNRA
ncbi:transcriptional regulator, LacI family [Loktanella fryxellensis]|uniref:Transcriptional regulator, LacI family n=1 Tax=Loktanella fryxellensis TaxID=245187 RepID=A0A1H8HQM9_9RHOB|nr:LacI family DNA-binding transcriptional regulator [Loktanella fryxellensis]SEN58512.1 transcriptional regulator, LacI family [Loktanella fryxellensis]